MRALFDATQDFCKKKNTLKILDCSKGDCDHVGKEKPIMEAPDLAHHCNDDQCRVNFNFFIRGKNCLSCGKVCKPSLDNTYIRILFIQVY